jgi:hypothetical protein
MREERPLDPLIQERIDLMRASDVAFWCRVFDIDMSRLRFAVQHAGPQAQAVRRFLEEHPDARA